MITSFGANEYGDKEGFSIKCNRCGKETNARLVPVHHYNDNQELEKIVLEIRCTCGCKFGAIIHGN